MGNGRACRLAGIAAVAALVAAPVFAREHRDRSSCDTGCGWKVQAAGPSFCGPNKQDTCIRYTLSGEGVPDHFGVYFSIDLEVVSTSPGARVVDLCSKGDPAMKVAPNCHEKLLRFNSAHGPFWVQFKGQHEKALTTAVVKKGYAVCANAIDGVGADPAPPEEQTACVNYCGNNNPHAQKKSVEIFNFKGCQMKFFYDPDGSVADFKTCVLDEGGQNCVEEGPVILTHVVDQQSTGTCQARKGAIGELDLTGGPNEGNTQGAFGDGWLNTGENSCATRMIGGWYYTVCY